MRVDPEKSFRRVDAVPEKRVSSFSGRKYGIWPRTEGSKARLDAILGQDVDDVEDEEDFTLSSSKPPPAPTPRSRPRYAAPPPAGAGSGTSPPDPARREGS